MSDPDAVRPCCVDMQRVFDFVEKLNEVDTTGVEPSIFMTEECDVLREDLSFLGHLQARSLDERPCEG